MIIYSGTKEKLNSDIVAGTLAHKISDEFVARLHYSTGSAEYRSWENSLREMNAVLQMSALPDDVEIVVEFQIPLTSKRVRSDKSLIGISSNSLHITADRIIRNTYKTLLTRDQKGCYYTAKTKLYSLISPNGSPSPHSPPTTSIFKQFVIANRLTKELNSNSYKPIIRRYEKTIYYW